MDLLGCFDMLPGRPELLCLVGGGGKTTTMYTLACALKQAGTRVLVTTTTNIFRAQADRADRVVIDARTDPELFGPPAGPEIVCYGSGTIPGKGKLDSADPAFLEALFVRRVFDHVLVEADGSKRLPIKAPAAYEPVIPAATTVVVGMVGLDALGTPIDADHVHRPALFCAVTGADAGAPVSEEHIVRLALHADGLFKDAPAAARRYLLLNKADTPAFRQRAAAIAAAIGSRLPVLAAAMQHARVERL